MALVTARFVPEARSPKQASINNGLYHLQRFRSTGGRKLRTGYPEFVRCVNSVPGVVPTP